MARFENPRQKEYTFYLAAMNTQGTYSEPNSITVYHQGILKLSQPTVNEYFQSLEIILPPVYKIRDIEGNNIGGNEFKEILGYVLRMERLDDEGFKEEKLPINEYENSKIVDIPAGSEWEITIGAYDSVINSEYNEQDFENTFSDPVIATSAMIQPPDISESLLAPNELTKILTGQGLPNNREDFNNEVRSEQTFVGGYWEEDATDPVVGGIGFKYTQGDPDDPLVPDESGIDIQMVANRIRLFPEDVGITEGEEGLPLFAVGDVDGSKQIFMNADTIAMFQGLDDLDSLPANDKPLDEYDGTDFVLLNEDGFSVWTQDFRLNADGNAYFGGELQAAIGTFGGELTAATGKLGDDNYYVDFDGENLDIKTQKFEVIDGNAYFEGEVNAIQFSVGNWSTDVSGDNLPESNATYQADWSKVSDDGGKPDNNADVTQYHYSKDQHDFNDGPEGVAGDGAVIMNQNGLFGQNADGDITFEINTAGNAFFAGTLQAATGTFGGELSAVNDEIQLIQGDTGGVIQIRNDYNEIITHLGNRREVAASEENDDTGVLILSDENGIGKSAVSVSATTGQGTIILGNSEVTTDPLNSTEGLFLAGGDDKRGSRIRGRHHGDTDDLDLSFRLESDSPNGARLRLSHADLNNVATIGTEFSDKGSFVSADYGTFNEISADTKNFKIKHPEPGKEDYFLWHSTVESPNEGDNIYRYEIDIDSKKHQLELPSYFKYLNKNAQVFITPSGHFGNAYGEVNENILTIYTDKEGKYNILVIGTRQDEAAVNSWKGTERHFNDSIEMELAYNRNEELKEREKERKDLKKRKENHRKKQNK